MKKRSPEEFDNEFSWFFKYVPSFMSNLKDAVDKSDVAVDTLLDNKAITSFWGTFENFVENNIPEFFYLLFNHYITCDLSVEVLNNDHRLIIRNVQITPKWAMIQL